MASIRELGRNVGRTAAKVGLITTISFGSTPAAAVEIQPVSHSTNWEPPCFPGSEYFYPIYDPSKGDAAHRYVGIGPHYGVAYQNLDNNYAADVFSFGNV